MACFTICKLFIVVVEKWESSYIIVLRLSVFINRDRLNHAILIMTKISKLKFKGEKSSESKKRKLSESDIKDDGNIQGDKKEGDDEVHEEPSYDPQPGTGRITSSSIIVHGHFTKFMDEIKPGDASKLCVQ